MSQSKIARFIDNTLLKPSATKDDILRLCDESIQYGFASACVNPYYVPLVAERLRGTGVMTCTVVGFPLGAMPADVKAYEAKRYAEAGADELDMVLNVGALRAGDARTVEDDVRAVVEAAAGRTVKVILETGLLTDAEKKLACALCVAAGAHFVKTCTGFAEGRATVEDIMLMRAAVGKGAGVKAAGGIRDLASALALIEAGANRIGTSAGSKIVGEEQSAG